MFSIKKILGFRKDFDLTNASPEFTQEILRDYNKSRPKGNQPLICFAPTKNLYFGHKGKVVACCYNRNFVLGKYPENSIKEIWFGKKASQLRKAIEANNLNYGCAVCKRHILAKNFDANKAKQYDEFRSNKNSYPSVLELELNNTCNLECKMCSGEFSSSIRKNRENLPVLQDPYDLAFVDQLEEFLPHLQEVKFYGGEPFLIDIYYTIWERIIKRNPKIRISVQTNGTILNNRVKEIMSASNFHMNVSIDSLQKERFQSIRKNAKYETVMENLDYFIDYCKEKNTFIGLSTCLMNNNWDELPNFINFCNERSISIYFHFVHYPHDCSLASLSSAELESIYKELSEASFNSDNRISHKNITHYYDTVKEIKSLTLNKTNNAKESISFDKFIELFSKFIDETPTINSEDKKHKKSLIRQKLEEIERRVDNKESFLSSLNMLNFEEGSFVVQAMDSIINMSIDDLVLMAQKSDANY